MSTCIFFFQHRFYDLLDEELEQDETDGAADSTSVLLKVSDQDGSLDTELVKEGPISEDDLQPEVCKLCSSSSNHDCNRRQISQHFSNFHKK